MPRASRKQVDLNREGLKKHASELSREKGFDGVGIAEITRTVGLTQGSFYGYFESKDALVSEACDSAFEAGFKHWAKKLLQGASLTDSRSEFIKDYLTLFNRDNPGKSCPIAALVGDVARAPLHAPVRRIFIERITQVLHALWSFQSDDDVDEVAERRALTELSTIVGAMLLARATVGNSLSENLLRAVDYSLTKSGV